MTTFTLNANGSTAAMNAPSVSELGATFELFLSGSLGGGTITVEQSPNNGVNWFTVGSSISALGRTTFSVFSQSLLRLTLAGATGPNLTAIVRGHGV